MSKKIIVMTLTIILSCLMLSTAFAENTKFNEINKKMNIETINDEQDKEGALGAVGYRMNNLEEISNKLGWNKTPVKNGEYYKIYQLVDNLKKYYDNGSFESLIPSCKIAWETPLMDSDGNIISTMRAVKTNGKWATSEGHGMPIEFINFYKDPENLQNILTQNGIAHPSQIKHMRIRELYIDFFYIKDGKDEYVLPFANEPDELSIKNFTLYKMPDFIGKLSSKYVNPNNINNPNGTKEPVYGGVDELPNQNYLLLGTIIISILMILSILFWAKRKKVSQNKV